MKKLQIVFIILISLTVVGLTFAQKDPPPRRPPADDFAERDMPDDLDDEPIRRGALIAKELGLTKDQQIQIRQLNQQRRPLMQQAQEKLKLANDELDELIYSDVIDEKLLQEKLRGVATAQAEITKIRALSEVAIRNVLTPDQLVKFRDLRDRFKQQQQDRQMRRQQRQNRRQLNQRNDGMRPPPMQNRRRPN